MNYFLAFLLFLVLVAIRAFWGGIFPDPLADYFNNTYLHAPVPELDLWNLFMGYSFRYLCNAIVSIGIIYFLFYPKKNLSFVIKTYELAYVILIPFVFGLLLWNENGYLLLFYSRRFLIHPLLLLVLLPASYIYLYDSKGLKK